MKLNKSQNASFTSEANSLAAQQAQTFGSYNILYTGSSNPSMSFTGSKQQNNSKGTRLPVLQPVTDEQYLGENENSENLLQRRLKFK